MNIENSFVIEGVTMIGNKLKALRFAKGMNQDEFAKFLGLSRQWYNHIETNRMMPTNEVVEQIEKALEVKLNDPRIEAFMSIAKPEPIAA